MTDCCLMFVVLYCKKVGCLICKIMAYFLLYNSSSLPNTAAVSSSVDACCVERYVETLAVMAKASNLHSGAVMGRE